MITYAFLQHYWWFLISLLGGLLAFLLFVQGGQSMLFSLPGNDGQKKVMLSVLGRKWEYTFTTLVTFGGALFASFPLFYSTSFGGAYWLLDAHPPVVRAAGGFIRVPFPARQRVRDEDVRHLPFHQRPARYAACRCRDRDVLYGVRLYGGQRQHHDSRSSGDKPLGKRMARAGVHRESPQPLPRCGGALPCTDARPAAFHEPGPATRSCGHGAGAACGTMPCLSSSSSSCS